MDWNNLTQSAFAWMVIGIWVWVVVSLIAETIIKKRDAAKLAEKDAIIWQLEQDRIGYSHTRRELIWVRDHLEWEKSRREQLQERADDLYRQLLDAYGQIRTSPDGNANEGGAPAQVAA